MTRFCVLVDTGCDWPDVVFVGTHDEARSIADKIDDSIPVSVQAIVTLEAALEAAASPFFSRRVPNA